MGAYAPYQVKQRFLDSGGVICEQAAAQSVTVHPNGVALAVPDQDAQRARSGNDVSASASATPSDESARGAVTGRLLIDCMGNFSPIVRQARWGQRPDGVCLVVGSCCRGFADNTTGAADYCQRCFHILYKSVPAV